MVPRSSLAHRLPLRTGDRHDGNVTVVIFGPIGAADELPRTVLMAAAWAINLAVAEYVIGRLRFLPRGGSGTEWRHADASHTRLSFPNYLS